MTQTLDERAANLTLYAYNYRGIGAEQNERYKQELVEYGRDQRIKALSDAISACDCMFSDENVTNAAKIASTIIKLKIQTLIDCELP